MGTVFLLNIGTIIFLLPIRWDSGLVDGCLKHECQNWSYFSGAHLQEVRRDFVWSSCFRSIKLIRQVENSIGQVSTEMVYIQMISFHRAIDIHL